MTLREYAAALERSRTPSDALVAKYIRRHEVRLNGWIEDCLPKKSGHGHSRAEAREDLTQVALLAVVEVVRGTGNADDALNKVQNAIHNQARRDAAWNIRRMSEEE